MTLDWPQKTALRVLLTGGDTLRVYPPETLPFRVFNNYGPTECTVVTTSVEVWPNTHPLRPPTIGRPIANRQVYILDAYRNPVPIGVVGEIYIGGDGVASGYLNRPELTAERFIYHSFDGGPEQRLYKSGDLARYLPDGNIEFLGRIDNQVKIRGYRIELGEIETVLAQHPAVRESAVMAREDKPGDPSTALGTGKQLVAYVVPKESAPAFSDLRVHLKAKLPDYMVPSAFVILESFPLTANGKVDRKALPPPDPDSADMEQLYVAPRNATEQIIAGIWAEILGRKPIGVHDNFFDLGGHSLLVTQILNRLRSRLKVQLPLRRMFEAPTIAELAEDVALMSERDVI
jgi:acyl-CoA synthetase (AMP-forming)/AMP-acid ligase II/acyl carrier protein